MKSMLLALMVLASAAVANDAKIKAMIVGTWEEGEGRTDTFTSDGRWLITDPKFSNTPADDGQRWDIEGGKFIKTPPAGRAGLEYIIVLLTKRELLLRENSHDQGYLFYWRKDED